MKDKKKLNFLRWTVYFICISLLICISISGWCGKISAWVEIDAIIISFFAFIITILENRKNEILRKEEDLLRKKEDEERRFLNFCIDTLGKTEKDVPVLIEDLIHCIDKYKETNEIERLLASKLLKNAVFKDKLYNYYSQISNVLTRLHSKKVDAVSVNDACVQLIQIKANLECEIGELKYKIFIGEIKADDLKNKEKEDGKDENAE